MNRLTFALTFIMCLLPFEPNAQSLHKCTAANGKVEYRDHPCDVTAASSQKVTARDNTSGSGDDLASIRRRDAEFKKRQDAKRAAQEKADERDRLNAERRYNEERAHRDRQDLVNAVREGNAPNYNSIPNYNNVPNKNYAPYTDSVQQPAVGPAATAKLPSSVPAQSKKPNQ